MAVSGDELAAFYAARLNDDERYWRVISEAGERRWADPSPKDIADVTGLFMDLLSDPEVWEECQRWEEIPAPPVIQRGLADIEADRAILARYEALRHPASLSDRIMFPALAEAVLGCIRERAARLSAHPDYKAEWKP